MTEEKQDVKQEQVASSTTEDNPVNEVADTGQQQQTEETSIPDTEGIPTTPDTEAGQPQVEAVDERGVPYKNLAMEWKRKYEELTEKMPDLARQAAQEVLQQQGTQPQQRKYTIAELEAFAQQNPEWRPWAEEEKAKLIREQLVKEVDEKIQSQEKQRESNIKRQQALQYVMQTYPEAFVKDSQGRLVSWNNSHPLTQQIIQIMQDERFAKDPEGLIGAADIAYARYVRQQTPQRLQKEQQMKAEIKNLQKKTLIEGGGKKVQQGVSPYRAAIEKAKSGRIEDAKEAFKEILKAQGLLSEEE